VVGQWAVVVIGCVQIRPWCDGPSGENPCWPDVTVVPFTVISANSRSPHEPGYAVHAWLDDSRMTPVGS
jgi:hypothetical protein